MTRTEQIRAVRRRGALDRDRGSRRFSFAVDAQRRLNTRPARGTPTKADAVGPSDPGTRSRRDPGHEDDDTSESGDQADITVDMFLFAGPRTDMARLSRAG